MMHWEKLLNPQRLGCPIVESNLSRSDFQRDYDRIIFSPAFRRLQGKTQVFPLPETDTIHNRLTHTLEVSSVGRSLGMSVGTLLHSNKQIENPNHIAQITMAACLAHDLGNPPFGHSGESAIAHYFDSNPELTAQMDEQEKSDLCNFEGNALGFRILTNHKKYKTTVSGGMGLTYATLGAFTKYPRHSNSPQDKSKASQKKFGIFKTETEIFDIIARDLGLLKSNDGSWCRHPLAFIMEAADDICYSLIDVEDGYKLNLVSFEAVEDLLFQIAGYKESAKIRNNLSKIKDKSEKIGYLRAKAIGALIEQCSDVYSSNYDSIMNGEYNTSIIDNCQSKNELHEIKQLTIEKIYNHEPVLQIEAAGFQVLPGLLDKYIKASIERTVQDKKIKSLIPLQFLNDEWSIYEKAMNIAEFVSSMTDKYAIKNYRILTGSSLPNE